MTELTVTINHPGRPVTLPEPQWCSGMARTARLTARSPTRPRLVRRHRHPGGRPDAADRLPGAAAFEIAGGTTDVVYTLDLADGTAACNPEQLRAAYRPIVDQARVLLELRPP